MDLNIVAQYIYPAEKAVINGKLVYGSFEQLLAQRDATPNSVLVAHYQIAYRVSEVIERVEQYDTIMTSFRKGIAFPVDFYIVSDKFLET